MAFRRRAVERQRRQCWAAHCSPSTEIRQWRTEFVLAHVEGLELGELPDFRQAIESGSPHVEMPHVLQPLQLHRKAAKAELPEAHADGVVAHELFGTTETEAGQLLTHGLLERRGPQPPHRLACTSRRAAQCRLRRLRAQHHNQHRRTSLQQRASRRG